MSAGVRVYLCLAIDNRVVARREITAQMETIPILRPGDKLQLPELFEPLAPNTFVQLMVRAELDVGPDGRCSCGAPEPCVAPRFGGQHVAEEIWRRWERERD